MHVCDFCQEPLEMNILQIQYPNPKPVQSVFQAYITKEFCSWDCTATWVRVNRESLIQDEHKARAIYKEGCGE